MTISPLDGRGPDAILFALLACALAIAVTALAMPAPLAPSAGAPRFPKIKTQFRKMLITCITKRVRR